jgi:diguanylate cyclase (GGDEF)-like protein
MKVIDPHLCSCESLMDLTYADTFKNLDERFVRAVGKLIKPGYVRLCLGDYEQTDQVVLATYQPDVGAKSDRKINLNTKALPAPAVIFPVLLSTGQEISLLLDVEPDERSIGQVTQLIAVYVNQHGHLTRSNKDQLTGLKNRRSFDLEYASLTNNAKPEDSNVIAVLDIDHFKQVNDKFGHIIGDETLIAVANLMKRFFLRDDYLYRFGGEEFIILFHDLNEAKAAELLDRLRLEVAQHAFPQIGCITVSI